MKNIKLWGVLFLIALSPVFFTGCIWGNDEFTMSFTTGTAQQIESVLVIENQTTYLPTTQNRVGYSFAGWYKEDVFINGPYTQIDDIHANESFFAKWILNTYNISYEMNGGVNNINNATSYTIEDSSVSFQTPTRSGYSFIGWEEGDVIDTSLVKNVTLTATWVALPILAKLEFGSIEGGYYVSAIDESITGDLVIPSVYNNGINGQKPVTIIMDDAFDGLDITSLTIPSSIITIGDSAFAGCTNLIRVDVPDGVTAIGNNVFDGCTNLTNVTLPNSLTTIGDYAFNNCELLAVASVPVGVTSVGDHAYDGCDSLTVAYISSTVISLGDYVFANCPLLADITMGENLETLGDYAFSGCVRLIDIVIPDKVYTIGLNTFNGCYALEYMKIGKSITVLNPFIFQSCISLSTVEVSANGELYQYYAFANSELLNSLETLIVSEGVTSIGDSAFAGCMHLTNVVLPDSITEIGDYAFMGTSVRLITLPINLIKIGEWAFEFSILNNLVIPDSVTTIEEYAFAYTQLTGSIVIPNGVTTLGQQVFIGGSGLTVYIEADSKPYLWHDDWALNFDGTIVWGYTG
jgi:uncharacterized repeat protein (TIGR02543 family)